MDKFFDVIKVFLEKHLIPTIASLVLTVSSILIAPKLDFIQQKVGIVIFWLFIFCCWFLVIKFFGWLTKKMQSGSQRIERYEQNAADNAKAVHEFYDSLSPEDKVILLNFIILENKPMKVRLVDTYSGLLHDKREMFNMTQTSNELIALRDEFWLSPLLKAFQTMNKSLPDCEFLLFRMKDSAYRLFKQVYDQDGKLGNF